VSAIGEGRRAAEVIDKYLVGAAFCRPNSGRQNAAPTELPRPYLVTTNPTADDYADYNKKPRVKLKHLPPEKRKTNFKEVTARITETQAKKEAMRCLECGCADFHECKLIKYTHQYNVNGDKYKNTITKAGADEKIPNITQTPDKCILCGLCVRICDEVVGAGILGMEGRGFDTTVTARFGHNCPPEICIDCGKCAEACPTGALIKREVNNGNL